MLGNNTSFWTRFDPKLRLHVPNASLYRYFKSIDLEFKNAQHSSFVSILEDSMLWQKDFNQWLPVCRKKTESFSFYLDEISSRLHSGLYDVLRKDWFASILATEAKLTDAGYRLRAKGELEQAEADAQYKESELLAIQKLVIRSAQEREEAEAAELVLQREKAQFLQSHEALRISREVFQKAQEEASKDGVIDLKEEEMITKLRVELRIAEAREQKERQEFEDAMKTRERECRELIEMDTRLREREAAFRLAAEEARASNALLNGSPRVPLCSLVNRVFAYESTLGPNDPDEPAAPRAAPRPRAGAGGPNERRGGKPGVRRRSLFHSRSQVILGRLRLWLDDTHAVIEASDGSGYLGEVAAGRPHGSGVEWCRASQVHYAGQYTDDLRHGLGCIVAPRAQFFYAGGWADGARAGRGIVGYITNDGAALPVAVVVCRENRVRSAERYLTTGRGENRALLAAVEAEVLRAIAAADEAEGRRRARQEGGGGDTLEAIGEDEG
mmetsp:Transcript_6339/g.13908  ORF Transcript_6339/g.13908 Transcript_6339/m.13908 type:complete len:499 (+) Transcript_6339:720-2216(+)